MEEAVHRQQLLIVPPYRYWTNYHKNMITCGQCTGWYSRRSLPSWPLGSERPFQDLRNTPQDRPTTPPYAKPEHDRQAQDMGGGGGQQKTRKEK